MFPQVKSNNDGFEVMESGCSLIECPPVRLLELVKRQYDLYSLDVLSLWLYRKLYEQLLGRIDLDTLRFCTWSPMLSKLVGYMK